MAGIIKLSGISSLTSPIMKMICFFPFAGRANFLSGGDICVVELQHLFFYFPALQHCPLVSTVMGILRIKAGGGETASSYISIAVLFENYLELFRND